MMLSPRTRPGLSLVEVIVSMAIFLVSLTALSQLIDMSQNAAYDAALTNEGTRIAQSILAEVEAGVLPVSGDESGEYELDSNWKWEIRSEELLANTWEVTVIVTNSRYRTVTVSLTQIVFDPYFQSDGAPAVNPNTGELTIP